MALVFSVLAAFLGMGVISWLVFWTLDMFFISLLSHIFFSLSNSCPFFLSFHSSQSSLPHLTNILILILLLPILILILILTISLVPSRYGAGEIGKQTPGKSTRETITAAGMMDTRDSNNNNNIGADGVEK